ncbi:Cwf19-like, C-terminal domain-1 [Artemisia annua]|uniref:Cwf19-like, C-terminal domain-1 n=1 Tax=Artemisia annua TaxID=35608 RepID=A0A2U1PT77_ARTAN|nr:Cwf19-like, C-terminal domain-1 [Artemisia annua]
MVDKRLKDSSLVVAVEKFTASETDATRVALLATTESPTTTGAQVTMIWQIAAIQADAIQHLTSTVALTGMLTALTKREKEAGVFAEPIVDITILPQASGDFDRLVWDYVEKGRIACLLAVKEARNHKSSFLADFREQKLGLHDMCFVAVNDDESWWKSSYGVNVIKGMLGLPGEYKHRHHRHESVHIQKQLVANFERGRDPFDCTEQLYL